MGGSVAKRTPDFAAALPARLFQGQIAPLSPLASLLALGLTFGDSRRLPVSRVRFARCFRLRLLP